MLPSDDYAVIATTRDGRVRVLAAQTTQLAEEARRRHDASPTAVAALGRALTGAALLGLTLKDEGTVTLRLVGDGPAGGVVAQADAEGHVRGYIKRPEADLPPTPAGKLDVGGLIGREGFIHVTRDLGLKEPYTGTTPLVSGEVGDDLTRYLFDSEQTPSAVALGVLVAPPGVVRAAGGLFVQLMPTAAGKPLVEADAAVGPAGGPRAGEPEPLGVMPGLSRRVTDEWDEEKILGKLEEALAQFRSVSHLIEEGLGPEDLVERALGALPYRIHGRRVLRFQCYCTRERARGLLMSLSPADLAEIREAGQGAELVCQFCSEAYRFDPRELQA